MNKVLYASVKSILYLSTALSLFTKPAVAEIGIKSCATVSTAVTQKLLINLVNQKISEWTPTNRKIRISGQEVTLLSQLPPSALRTSAAIYLSESNQNARSITKVYSTTSPLALYEVRATEFYNQREFLVPKVIVSDIRSNKIVKEFTPGLRYNELFDDFEVDTNEIFKIQESWMAAKSQYAEAFKHFDSWLSKNYPNDYQTLMRNPTTANLVREGDLKLDNFLFDVQRWQWVLIDP